MDFFVLHHKTRQENKQERQQQDKATGHVFIVTCTTVRDTRQTLDSIFADCFSHYGTGPCNKRQSDNISCLEFSRTVVRFKYNSDKWQVLVSLML